jgi:pectate lyase
LKVIITMNLFRFFLRPNFYVLVAVSCLSGFSFADNGDAKAKAGVCKVKDISVFLGRTDGLRGIFAFPTIQEAVPDSEVVTECVKLAGLGVPMPAQMQRGSPVSVNGAAFMVGPLTVKDGDEIRVKLKASSKADDRKQEYLQFGGAGSFGANVGSWGNLVIRTRNTARPAKVFQVGPTRSYKQVTEIVNDLSAGDVVEVDSGTYAPFELTRAGTLLAPITIRGVGATRPIVNGGNWGVSFKYSDNVVLENFEISGASTICLRTMANNVTVRNVYIHNCTRHGVLGADLDNGTNIFDRVEITKSGSIIQGESYNHALYVATDRDSFPEAVLRVQQSFFHNNKGNSIKSRAGRAEIYSNWIDVPDDPDSFYSVELIGYQEYATDTPINADVVGNVLVHRKTYGLRLGGDGTGTSKGRVRMANNTLIVSAQFGPYSPVIRLDQEIDSLYLLNNAFVLEQGANFPMRLLRSGVSKWVSGRAKVAGANNVLPVNAYMDTVPPLNSISLQKTVYASSVISNAFMASLDVIPLNGSKLLNTALPLSTIAPGYEIPNPMLKLMFPLFSKRPISTQWESSFSKSKPSDSFSNIGAH